MGVAKGVFGREGMTSGGFHRSGLCTCRSARELRCGGLETGNQKYLHQAKTPIHEGDLGWAKQHHPQKLELVGMPGSARL